ncbi:MAG: hypothetical protein Kow0074_12920 [Candidatus Zixiibacteriota bacterium]
MKRMRNVLLSLGCAICCTCIFALSAIAAPATPWSAEQKIQTQLLQAGAAPDATAIPMAAAVGDPVDFDAALLAGADYLQAMQADITDDNAGNGTNGVDETPDDPDDGGWDWAVASPPNPFHHTTTASPKNIYGATAMGLYYAYLESNDAGYFTALTDAANIMMTDPNIRSGADVVFLMLYNDLPAVAGTAYADSARAKYIARVTTYGSALGFAQYIRDARAGQGYENGIIAWDIGIWARAAAMLHDRYPGNGYDTDADDIASVIWEDSFNDNPGYFDVVDDAGFDPTYTDKNFWWYTLGITGLITAFDASGSYTFEIPGLVQRLYDSQQSGGAITGSYGANAGDEDWQSTAYTMMTLGLLDQATHQAAINRMGYWIGATQDTSGGWVYSTNNHYPEVGGENTAGLYFTDNTLTDVLVDASFTSQADVDVYNAANSTNYVWGYDAFATIQEGINAVNGSTVNVMPGTYYEAITISTDNLHLLGADRNTVIIDATGLAANNAGIYVTDSADNVTLEGFTLMASTANSLPRYGIKFDGNTGGTITDVTVHDIYRTGIDLNGTNNILVSNVESRDNGGNGMQSTDANGVTYNNVTTSGNAWGGIGVFTWGQYYPLGTSGIVFTGTNSFGEPAALYLEEGNYSDPGNPEPITYSTSLLDGADVTIQTSDFSHAVHGNSDNSNNYTFFFSDLTTALTAARIPYPGLSHLTDGRWVEELGGTNLYVPHTTGSIIAAIGAANPGDVIHVDPGTFAEGPQVHIDKDITIIGDSPSTTKIIPTANTTTSGDGRGWFLVDEPVTFNLSQVELDGTGFLVWQAIRMKGAGTFDYVDFYNIRYQASGSPYSGVAIAAFGTDGTDDVSITNCNFAEIGRVGALLFGAGLTNSVFSNNSYTGKGDGDWLDYAADISAGAVVTAHNNVITNCTGVAASDGSTSAGLLVSTYFGPGTTADLEGNRITGCTSGLALGYDGSDASTVIATNGNEFVGNEYGVVTSASPSISLTFYGNVFSNTTENAEDNTAGGTWDDGAGTGNCWTDFELNSGYPTNYVVGGTAGAVDNYPTVDCGLDMTPDDILYLCSGTFTFDVNLGSGVQNMEAANITLKYPANIEYVGATKGNANFTLFVNEFDNASGYDSIEVSLGVLSGDQDGPALLFTIEMSSSSDVCPTDAIEMTVADLRDASNLPFSIPAPLAAPVTLTVDCDDPVFTINTADGGYYNVEPVINIQASDNCDLDAIYYQIDGCNPGGWTALATGLPGTTYGPANWTLPTADWTGLTEAVHCIRFKVMDDNTRGNADSCTTTWCFTKDVTAPPAPTNLVALPGHNKVNLTWTNATTDFDHTVVMRTDWSGAGHGYPEYDDDNAEGPYPTDTTFDDLVYSGTAELLTDTIDLSNSTRDVYHYAAFTVDAAGNVSAPSNGARATSYWLGDVAGSGGLGSYDGAVYFEDLAILSTTYNKSHGDAGYQAQFDIGPTVTFSPKGIPTTDNVVEFEDLSIFSINFDAVSPLVKRVPLFASDEPDGLILNGTGLAIQVNQAPSKIGDQFTTSIVLSNSDDAVKSIHVRIPYDAARLEFVGAAQSAGLKEAQLPIFFHAEEMSDGIDISLSVLGNEAVFEGSGEVAQLTFRAQSLDPINLDFGLVDLRDNANEKLHATAQGTAVLAGAVPQSYSLGQNYPNPFNAGTQIRYTVPEEADVEIVIYNVNGQRVRTLVTGHHEPGVHTIEWDGMTDNGHAAPSGVYFTRMSAGRYTAAKKMILLK